MQPKLSMYCAVPGLAPAIARPPRAPLASVRPETHPRGLAAPTGFDLARRARALDPGHRFVRCGHPALPRGTRARAADVRHTARSPHLQHLFQAELSP